MKFVKLLLLMLIPILGFSQTLKVPTIIVFKDGEEVKRFQADISFTMKATKEEVQEVIDDNNQSDF